MNNPVKYLDPSGHFACIWQACAGLDTPGTYYDETPTWIYDSWLSTPDSDYGSITEKDNALYTRLNTWFDAHPDWQAATDRYVQWADSGHYYQLTMAHVTWATDRGVNNGELGPAVRDLGQSAGFQHALIMWESAAGLASFMKPSLPGKPVIGLSANSSVDNAVHIGSIENIFGNPSVLSGKTPSDLSGIIDAAQVSGWQVGTLSRGSHKGEGLVIRELTVDGNLTGRMIQWHPGGGHHGSEPYWKVSSPAGGTVRVGSQFGP